MALKGCIGYFRHTQNVLSGKTGALSDYTPSNRFVHRSFFEDYPLHDRFKEGEIPYIDQIPTTQELYRTFLQKRAVSTRYSESEVNDFLFVLSAAMFTKKLL